MPKTRIQIYSLRLTAAPSASFKVKVSPAGTVNAEETGRSQKQKRYALPYSQLMVTELQSERSEASSMELTVQEARFA